MHFRLWLMSCVILALSSTPVFAQRDLGGDRGSRARRASGAFAAGIIAGAAISRAGMRDFGESLADLSGAEQERFEEGAEEFTSGDTAPEGLGPVFNEFACVTCHNVPAVGGGSIRLETRFGTTTNGEFDPLEDLGGSLLQDHALGIVESCSAPAEFFAEVVPPQASIVARRRTTPLFGMGLVAAVPKR
jgi:hypothetical protein